jgi:perosamine synthetase
VSSANAILYVGAKPVFVDIDPITYNIDPAKIEKKITSKTKAILPVHIFGQMAKMDEIMRIAHKHKLVVIEDACESLLASYKGKKAGTFGQSGVFAFYPNKQMTTGEGGMVVTNDARVAGLCRSLRNQGREPHSKWLDHDRLGYNYRLPEMNAALGLAQIENINFLIKKRQELARWYSEALEPLSGLIDVPVTAKGATHTWFVYVVALKNKKLNRDALIKALEKRGVHTKPYLPSIHLFNFYRKMGHRKGECPVSEGVSARTIALPFYIGLTKTDVAQIAKILKNVITPHEK